MRVRATLPRSRRTGGSWSDAAACARRVALALVLVLVLAACGTEPPASPSAAAPPPRPDGPLPVLLAQAPRGARSAAGEGPHGLVSGSRLLLVDAQRPAEPGRVLSTGFDAIGDVALHHDGRRLCFVGRREPQEAPGLWVATLDGEAPRLLVVPDGLPSAPAWLPDDRVVFVAPSGAGGGEPGAVAPPALFVVGRGGEPPERITFSGLPERDPSVLRDGRIVYVGRNRPGEGTGPDARDGGLGLFTVHPDGTGVSLFHGPRPGWRLRPRQAADGTVYFVERSPGGRGALMALDWRAPFEEARPLEAPGDVLGVEATGDGRLLVVSLPDAGTPAAVHLLDATGRALGGPFFADGEFEVLQALEAAPRARPQGQLSMVQRDKDHGTLMGIDARPTGSSGAVAVRLSVLSAGATGPEDGATARRLGDAPLAEDGSFYVKVPPDVPLVLEVVDAGGGVLERTHTPFWVRPNEIRGCTGCHDAPDVTPPNRQPLAVRADPVSLLGGAR